MSFEAKPSRIPPGAEMVFREFRTAEFTTISSHGYPITWPVYAHWEQGSTSFLVSTSIGLPAKANNIKRRPRVSLLFSDPTASGLGDPPAVLVQGEARVLDRIFVYEGMEQYWGVLHKRQPLSTIYHWPGMRWLMDWYYMRFLIRVSPKKVWIWPKGDFSQEPEVIGVGQE